MTLKNTILGLYIHSNLHVSIAASCMVLLSYKAINIENNTYVLFVFISSMALYSLHKFIGAKKTKEFIYFDRININQKYNKQYLYLTILSLIGAIYIYAQMPRAIQNLIIIPSLLSIGYTIPMYKGKRLRDYPLIKIFIIALSWSFVCAFIPFYEANIELNKILSWITVYTFYIFANTIPFDIRDFEIDKHMNIMTIPTKYGILRSIKISQLALVITTILLLFMRNTEFINPNIFNAMIISIVIAFFLISKTKVNNSTYYVSGVIEGLQILPIVLYFLLENLEIY